MMGEPYFVPGTPIAVDRKGLGDAEPGDLVSVTTGRGRARVERVIGPAKRIENVLEALLVEEGLREGFEPHDVPGADTRGPHRSPRPDDVHRRSGHREGLRRRDLGSSRGRRRPDLGAHRRCLVLRPGRHAARPRGVRARQLGVRARARRAHAPARARRRRLLAPAAPGPAVRDGGDRARRRAELLPIRHPQPGAVHVRAGATDPRGRRAARAGRRRPAGRQRLGRASGAGASPAARFESRAPRSTSRSTGRAGSSARGSRRNRRRTP